LDPLPALFFLSPQLLLANAIMAHYRPEQHNILHYADEFFGHSNRKRPRLIYKIYLEEKIQKTKAGGKSTTAPLVVCSLNDCHAHQWLFINC